MHDFNDWNDDTVIPEACVLDMMRGRAVCKKGDTMVRLQTMLMRGVEVTTAAGQTIRISSARNKLKLHGADLDPMHFRNILNNLILSIGDRSIYVELQIHHFEIYRHNEISHAHDRYDFFRALLAGEYQGGL